MPVQALKPIVRPALIPNVGPDMMPNVELALLTLMDLKYEVNTYTKNKEGLKLSK